MWENSNGEYYDSHDDSIATECVKTVKDYKFVKTALILLILNFNLSFKMLRLNIKKLFKFKFMT